MEFRILNNRQIVKGLQDLTFFFRLSFCYLQVNLHEENLPNETESKLQYKLIFLLNLKEIVNEVIYLVFTFIQFQKAQIVKRLNHLKPHVVKETMNGLLDYI